MNSNLFHNIVNVVTLGLALITAILMVTGCTELPGGDVECSASFLSPTVSTVIISVLQTSKIVVNIVRDGFRGLTLPQPPVRKD